MTTSADTSVPLGGSAQPVGGARRFPPGLLFFLAGVSALVLLTGPVPQVMYASDVFNFLDGAQRQSIGQVIHRDFNSPIGGLAFLPFSLAMRFTGPSVAALPWGVALNFLGLGPWAWLLARVRLTPAAAAIFTALIGLLVAATYSLDFGSWRMPSYAMYYNRTCWALLGLLALECFVPPAHLATAASNWRGGISSGAALAGLLLVKVNFFAGGIVLLAGAFLLQRTDRGTRLLPVIAGLAGTVLLASLVARIDLTGYAGEIAGMSASQTGDTYVEVARRIIGDNSVWLLAAGIIVLCLGLEARAAPGPAGRDLWRTIAIFALVLGAGLFVSIANCQYAELPTPLFGLLILAALLRTQPASRLGAAVGIAAFVLSALFALPQAGMVVRAGVRRWEVPAHDAANGLHLELPAVSALALRPWPGDPEGMAAADTLAVRREVSPFAFGQWLQDGLALLRPHVNASSRVISLDWSNPFPFCLGLPPTTGDQIAWHYGRTLSDTRHPDAGRLVQQADFVMEPRFSLQPASLAFKRRIFSKPLQESFAPLAESHYWILWQRRSSAPVPAVAQP